MVERAVIDEMLSDYRFEEAEQLLGTDSEPDLREEVARRRAHAEEEARVLYTKIAELGDQGQHQPILDLASASHSSRLLALLPETSRRRAEAYMRSALRWEETRRETHGRRLGEARKAVDGLDLDLAKGLLKRIDPQFLTEDQRVELDQVVLDLAAREMEAESLAETTRTLIEKHEPKRRPRKRPWWRR